MGKSVEEVASVMTGMSGDLISAVQHVRQARVVHQDIKPANIMGASESGRAQHAKPRSSEFNLDDARARLSAPNPPYSTQCARGETSSSPTLVSRTSTTT